MICGLPQGSILEGVRPSSYICFGYDMIRSNFCAQESSTSIERGRMRMSGKTRGRAGEGGEGGLLTDAHAKRELTIEVMEMNQQFE